jgi:glutamine synthetase
MAILAPTSNCYRRFVHHSFAPVNVSWGLDDRTTLVRARNTFDNETHLENRLPTAICNPYLAVAAIIASGILGLKEEERPHAPVHGPAEEHEDFAPLPTTLGQALEALEGDTALRAILGEEFIDIFLKIKRYELARQQEHTQQQVTRAEVEWEIQEYLADY